MMKIFKENKILVFLLKPIALQSPVVGSHVFHLVAERIGRVPFFRSEEKVGTFVRWLAILMIFSCVFIPRVCLGSISSARIDLKVEDFLIFLLAFLALRSPSKEIASRGGPSVETAFLLFLIAAEISIFAGIAQKTIDKPFVSVLYLLKWAEYFLVFFVASRLARTEQDLSFLIGGFFVFGLVIAGYGYWEHFFPLDRAVYPNYYRLFERGIFHGDANHIGGLLVLWIGFFTGIYLKWENRFIRWVLFVSILFAFLSLTWTYSRKSYFALSGALILSFVFVKERKQLLLLVLSLIILSLFLPTRLSERLMELPETFNSADPFHSSWAGNWVMWKDSLWNFNRFAVLGSGLGSRHRLLYESQYVLILAETGLVGCAAFAFLCFSMVRRTILGLIAKVNGKYQSIALGWLIGFIGLLIHSGSCVSWTVSKIAMPFWFLTGIVFCFLKIAESFPAESLNASK